MATNWPLPWPGMTSGGGRPPWAGTGQGRPPASVSAPLGIGQYLSPGFSTGALADPGFQALGGLLSAQSAQDAAARSMGVQRALINFGEVPSDMSLPGVMSGYWGQDVTDVTRGLASQNTQAGLSLQARLAKENDNRRRGLMNDLAARGAIDSGETGYQLGELGQSYTQAQFDARQQLMDYLLGLYQGFAQQEWGRQQQLLSEAMAAASRRAQRSLSRAGF